MTKNSDPIFVVFDENNVFHQEPIRAISAWQEFNDIDDRYVMMIEKDLAWEEHWEKQQTENENGLLS